jgi:SAM-dependent methyltransferase
VTTPSQAESFFACQVPSGPLAPAGLAIASRSGTEDSFGEGPEGFLRRFHAEHPAATSAALARTDTYDRLAVLVPPGARALDLGAGDGHLGELLARRGARATGVDLALEDLALLAARARALSATVGPAAPGTLRGVAARAQALPFADASFDVCVCHLAFMLMEDAAAVAGELARVLVPGGLFAAILGGGPVALPPGAPGDAFHRFLAIAGPRFRPPPSLGDPRARSEAGWRTLFTAPDWDGIAFERREVELAGSFDEVWQFLGASYQLRREDAGAVRSELAASLSDLADEAGRVPCRMVTWLGTARRGAVPAARR